MLFMVRPDRKSVHLLADLLETIEVTADELLDQKFPAPDLAVVRAMSDGEVQEQLAALRRFVARVQALELAIVAKLGQARDRARQVARTDWRLRSILMLFTSGTQAFADLIAAEASASSKAFNGASQMFPYLRSRGLLPVLATHYDGSAELLVTDGFRLMGMLQLRELMERCEATLNALDAHYDLYDLEDADAEEEAAAQESQQPSFGATSATSPTDPSASTSAVTEPIKADAPAAEAEPPINWGESLPPVPEQAISAQALPGVAETSAAPPEPGAVAASHMPEVAPPSEAEIASAKVASEAGLKSLTERLAELKSEPATLPATDATTTAPDTNAVTAASAA